MAFGGSAGGLSGSVYVPGTPGSVTSSGNNVVITAGSPGQWINFGSFAGQVLAGTCSGRYNCEDTLTSYMAPKVAGLSGNPTFRRMAREAFIRAMNTGVEISFGGIGYDNFKPTTGLIPGFATGIPDRVLKHIRDTGAEVFFHTHQNTNLFPGPSPGDQSAFSRYGFFGVIYAAGGLGIYVYDATATRR